MRLRSRINLTRPSFQLILLWRLVFKLQLRFRTISHRRERCENQAREQTGVTKVIHVQRSPDFDPLRWSRIAT